LARSTWFAHARAKSLPAGLQRIASKSSRPRIILKQSGCLPGIALEDMKTISNTMTMETSFKQAQLLPGLTPEMTVELGGTVALRGVWPGRESPRANCRATQRSVSTRLPQPCADQSSAERALFGLLALGAAVGVGQGLALMIEMAPNWPLFNALVARLLG
jgi:hypothetical protein